ncbi:glycosyltransferase [Halomonas cupida]|uniref:Glycosyl transferases group 1 n=1 Tax=Halomonas cupida TaxID=44933 RepID=A0A1M7IVN8_9GAMM|nr:glycosyltransferase [Halomonas cupida]GEN24204.1 hypothetical protein HCU01_21530 [Halomonas cupida]SHM44713.1 hypothetical protein SAMN05660971_02997 [Halomonas cupida]
MLKTHSKWILLSDGARPTEDIYFLASAAPWLRQQGARVLRLDTRRWQHPRWCWPWLKSVLNDAHVIVVRGLPEDWIQSLGDMRNQLAGLYYVIDDDLKAAAKDSTLPDAYRQRMILLDAQQQQLLPLVDEVVTCSTALESRLASHHRHISVLPPALISPLPNLGHFQNDQWTLGFHGTRAHLADLKRIAPALSRLHDHSPRLNLDIMLGRFTPSELSSLPRVATPSPLGWKAFRGYQQRQRLQIGLAPLWPTPFNNVKSVIKYLDIAVMGGAGIFSRHTPYSQLVEDGRDGLLAEDTPDHWFSCAKRLLDYPDDARAMAQAAADKARDIGNPARTQQFWSRRQRGE